MFQLSNNACERAIALDPNLTLAAGQLITNRVERGEFSDRAGEVRGGHAAIRKSHLAAAAVVPHRAAGVAAAALRRLRRHAAQDHLGVAGYRDADGSRKRAVSLGGSSCWTSFAEDDPDDRSRHAVIRPRLTCSTTAIRPRGYSCCRRSFRWSSPLAWFQRCLATAYGMLPRGSLYPFPSSSSFSLC